MLRHSVDDITAWMNSTAVHGKLALMVKRYLLAQSTKLWVEYLDESSPAILHTLADIQDRLGWGNFVEGRVSKVFMTAVCPQLMTGRRNMTPEPERWCSIFISKLLSLTHKQWLFRNSHVHYKKLEGLTPQEHEEIFSKVRELMWTDPADLLARHQHLLEGDFRQLGEGSSGVRQQWIESMESALKAAALVKTGRQFRGNPGIFVPAQTYTNIIRPSADGTYVYRRKRHSGRG